MDYQIYQGPDGVSLLCSNQHFNYVTVADEKVVCPECHEVRRFYFPRTVECASPQHNDAEGCSNPNCWKAQRK